MNRSLIPISAAVITVLGVLFVFGPFGIQEESENEYLILRDLPHGQPSVRMHQAFESGRIFFKLADQQFAWHPSNFDPGLLGVEVVTGDLIPKEPFEIEWDEDIFENFALVRDRMHEAFYTGEIYSPLDDSLFAWKTFFLDDNEDEE